MKYYLSKVTLTTDNTPEGMQKIQALWNDIFTGNIPLLCDTHHHPLKDVIPVSCYSDYISDENGTYDLTIMTKSTDFFIQMEEKVKNGSYLLYEETSKDGNIEACTKQAWSRVWNDQKINRSFTMDYEVSIPQEFSQDHQAHCYLYIAVKQ